MMGMGMTQEAQSLMEEARKVAESSSKIKLQDSQADYYSGRNDVAMKPKQFLVDAKMKQLEEAYTSGRLSPEEYKLGMQNILQANTELDAATVGAKNRSGLDTTANTMQNYGEFTGNPALLNEYLTNKAKGAGGGTAAAKLPSADIQAVDKLQARYDANPTPENLENLEAGLRQLAKRNGLTIAQLKADVDREKITATASQQEQKLVAEFGQETGKALLPYQNANIALGNVRSEYDRVLSKWASKVPEKDRTRLYSDVSEFFKDWTSTQDERSEFLLDMAKLAREEAFSSLKQLGANPSNADREFVMQDIPNKAADPQYLLGYIKRMRDMADNGVNRWNNAYGAMTAERDKKGGKLMSYEAMSTIDKAMQEYGKQKTSPAVSEQLPQGWSVRVK
jgi:hypothetical protein